MSSSKKSTRNKAKDQSAKEAVPIKAIEIIDRKAAKQPIEEAKLKSPEKRIDSQESSVVEMSQSQLSLS